MATTSLLNRYRFISRLGTGGTSMVILAEDTILGRPVALKQIYTPDDAAARSRLRREAVIGASLSHPNLVSIYDIITGDHGEDVIVMEFVEGETLRARLRRGEKPDVATTLRILDGVGAALDAIHARGIVHRDVKPGNVLLGLDGSVKLADLGIAAVADGTQITTSGSVVGTFSYMAPEQLESAPATPAVDIYALAGVAFEALSGTKARHERNAVALARAIATEPPPDLRTVWPEAPAAAAQVLTQAMSRDPEARPRSAGELMAQLRAALELTPRAPAVVTPTPTAARGRAKQPSSAALASGGRRSRGAVLAAAATLLAGLAVAAIVVSTLSGTSQKRVASLSGAHQRLAAGSGLRSTRGAVRTQTSTSVRNSARAAVRHTKPKVSPPPAAPVYAQPAAHLTPQPASPTSAASVPQASPTPASSSAGASPIYAVESFYHLAAAHDYPAAWALADPSFRAELAGYSGLQGTMAAERAIIFNGASVLNESPSDAVVSVRTTSVRDSGTQSCYGTVNLLRAGSTSPGWVLDHIAISCV